MDRQPTVKSLMRHMIQVLKRLSPLAWLRYLSALGRSDRSTKLEESDRQTEIYVVLKTIMQALLFAFMWNNVSWWVGILTAWFLVDTLVALIDIQLFHQERVDEAYRSKKEVRPLDPVRSIILVSFNLVQVVFAFALFYSWMHGADPGNFRFEKLPSLYDWVNFSLMTLTTFGDPTISAIHDASKCLVSLEVTIGLIMVAIVPANFASMLIKWSEAEGKTRDEE